MKKFLLLLSVLAITACSPNREVIEVIKGDPGRDGTSCSVAPEMSTGESQELLGARVSCTDGSYAVILNGQQGIQGEAGVPGQNGLNGQDAEACQAYRVPFIGAFLKCPGQWPVLIADGKDGEDGKDGASCTSERQNSQERVKITCKRGNHVESISYVYDGEQGQNGKDGKDGKDGKSCTATAVSGGVSVKCGNSAPVFLADGHNGADGQNGQDGKDGLNGRDGEDGADAITPGLTCDVYDINSWDNNTKLPELFVGSAYKGNFTLNAFNIPDSQSSLGFPGMPSALQNAVGLEGYALDCFGYLNVPTSGEYTMKLLSDDGSELRINDKTVVGNQGLHSPTTVTKKVDLNKGQNRINVVYYQGPHSQIALELKWSGPNLTEQVIPASKYTH